MSNTTLHTPDTLRARSEEVSAYLPALLADAQHLAATVLLGEHGRKRAGQGDNFWQYRPAQPGDSRRRIDWRQSGRTDGHFVRETEWQAAQSVMLWIDDAGSMTYSGHKDRPSKLRRAQTLGMAIAILAQRAGERIGLMNLPEPPRSGKAQLLNMARALMDPIEAADYGAPRPQVLPNGSRGVFLSDFMGDIAATETALTTAADRGVKGAIVHILDPTEESFPFDGRTVFQSMTGAVEFETMRAKTLRDAYLDRLAARKAALQTLCVRTGWRYYCHHTDGPAEPALLWLYAALERAR